MNKTKSIQDWDKWVQSEEYQKLDKKQNEYRDKKEEILELRTKIFNKLNLDNEDKNNIVELIHNVKNVYKFLGKAFHNDTLVSESEFSAMITGK